MAVSIQWPDVQKLMRQIGFSDADLRHFRTVAEIYATGVEKRFLNALRDSSRERRVARKIMRDATK
jgi:hypothetical protein